MKRNYGMTFFRTLNKEEGNIDLKKYYDLTRGGFVKDKVELIRNYVAEDNRAMVDKTKKSLPSVTVAGFFEKCRASYSLPIGMPAKRIWCWQRNAWTNPVVI